MPADGIGHHCAIGARRQSKWGCRENLQETGKVQNRPKDDAAHDLI
jgi:hypothetical protein